MRMRGNNLAGSVIEFNQQWVFCVFQYVMVTVPVNWITSNCASTWALLVYIYLLLGSEMSVSLNAGRLSSLTYNGSLPIQPLCEMMWLLFIIIVHITLITFFCFLRICFIIVKLYTSIYINIIYYTGTHGNLFVIKLFAHLKNWNVVYIKVSFLCLVFPTHS